MFYAFWFLLIILHYGLKRCTLTYKTTRIPEIKIIVICTKLQKKLVVGISDFLVIHQTTNPNVRKTT